MFDRHLYASFGDYDANTGPIAVVSLDLDDVAGGWSTEVTLNTEQTYMMRVFDGKMYVPFVDPQGTTANPENGQVARATAAGAWTVLDNVTPVPVHVWDTAVTADGWWLFGSSEIDGASGSATIWRSTDAGATWATSLHVPSGGSWDESVNAGNRFYAVQQYPDGTLIATSLGADAPDARAYLWTPSGSSWTDITDENTSGIGTNGQVGFTYQGTPFFLALGNSAVSVLPADSAERATIAALVPLLQDAFVTGDHLYGLGYDGKVWRATTDGTWTVLLTLADSAARSIAVDETDGWIYVGTTDGRVGRCVIPA